MIKPKSLKLGNRVALIAPASPISEEKLQVCVESMEFLGLVPVIYPSCRLRNGYLSGTDEERASDINKAFADPAIHGIFCVRGGYGTTRILPLLDYELIKRNPKIFVGYSDITAIHSVFNKFCNMITIHGPMPNTGYHIMDYFSLESLTDIIYYDRPPGYVPNPSDRHIETVVPGFATGRITGGNLSVLAASLGSHYEVDTKDKILFIEDVDERPYQIDRNLTALSLAEKFTDCVGIILGTFTNCKETEFDPELNLNLPQIIEQVIKPYGKPTIANFSCGHSYPNITIPMGAFTQIDSAEGLVSFVDY